jgi:hypothetical protein
MLEAINVLIQGAMSRTESAKFMQDTIERDARSPRLPGGSKHVNTVSVKESSRSSFRAATVRCGCKLYPERWMVVPSSDFRGTRFMPV